MVLPGMHGHLCVMKLRATECVHSKVTNYTHRRKPLLTPTYNGAQIPSPWASTSKCSHRLTSPLFSMSQEGKETSA